MGTVTFKDVKDWVIIALASNPVLMENLVLKGGIAIAYHSEKSKIKFSRASRDLDFSIDEDIDKGELKEALFATLEETFNEKGYKLLDFKFTVKPQKDYPETNSFWGGYGVEFKIISLDKYKQFIDDPEGARRNAQPLHEDHSTRFIIDMSKFEYVGDKQMANLDEYDFYIYSIEMIILEKVRALCQQLSEYSSLAGGTKGSARPRDFYDIHFLISEYNVDITTSENLELLQKIFDAKRVPLEFIELVLKDENLSFHEQSWNDVVNTLSIADKDDLQEFKFYTDFFKDQFGDIKNR